MAATPQAPLMVAAGVSGCDVLLQSEDGRWCRGFTDISVERPVRILIRSGTPASASTSAQLADALTQALRALGDELPAQQMPCGSLLVDRCMAEIEQHTLNVLVWVGSAVDPEPSESAVVEAWLQAGARATAVAVVLAGRNPYGDVPQPLRDREVVWWSGDADRAAQDVLTAAAVVTADRRLFVSYSHADGVELANAVFHALSEARFAVFLDAFALAPGVDFAERIENALLDKAFLLLIETPAALKSPWVGRELNYARRHRLGIASVWPAGGPRLAGIGRSRRWTVPPGALASAPSGGPVLQDAAADDLRDLVSRLHGEAMLRRRGVLIAGMRRALSDAGVAASDVHAVPYGLDVDAAGRRWPLAFSPRPATLVDMHVVARRAAAGGRGVVVSATPAGRVERDALDWLDAVTPAAHWDEGLLLSLARALVSGQV